MKTSKTPPITTPVVSAILKNVNECVSNITLTLELIDDGGVDNVDQVRSSMVSLLVDLVSEATEMTLHDISNHALGPLNDILSKSMMQSPDGFMGMPFTGMPGGMPSSDETDLTKVAAFPLDKPDMFHFRSDLNPDEDEDDDEDDYEEDDG